MVVDAPAAVDRGSQLELLAPSLCGLETLTLALDQVSQARSELGGEAHGCSERRCSKE